MIIALWQWEITGHQKGICRAEGFTCMYSVSKERQSYSFQSNWTTEIYIQGFLHQVRIRSKVTLGHIK